MLYKISSPYSQKTHCVSNNKANQLMLQKMSTVKCNSQAKHTRSVQNADFPVPNKAVRSNSAAVNGQRTSAIQGCVVTRVINKRSIFKGCTNVRYSPPSKLKCIPVEHHCCSSLLSVCTLRQSGQGLKLNAHLKLVPRLQMGAVSHCPI